VAFHFFILTWKSSDVEVVADRLFATHVTARRGSHPVLIKQQMTTLFSTKNTSTAEEKIMEEEPGWTLLKEEETTKEEASWHYVTEQKQKQLEQKKETTTTTEGTDGDACDLPGFILDMWKTLREGCGSLKNVDDKRQSKDLP